MIIFICSGYYIEEKSEVALLESILTICRNNYGCKAFHYTISSNISHDSLYESMVWELRSSLVGYVICENLINVEVILAGVM